MDIQAFPRGYVGIGSDSVGRNDVDVEIPLVFTSVQSGPSGILDVFIHECTVGGMKLEVSRDPTIHVLEQKAGGIGSTGVSLLGPKKTARPVEIEPDRSGSTTLGFRFGVHVPCSEGGVEQGLLSLAHEGRAPVLVHIEVFFSSGARVDLLVRGILAPSTGTLSNLEVNRKSSAVPTLLNLGGLVTVTLGVLVWATLLNSDVYQQKQTLSHHVVTALLGSLLTFLGLSLSRVRGWLGTLTNLQALFRFPELHVNLGLYRALSARYWGLALGVVFVVCVVVIVMNWSVGFKLPEHMVLLDTRNNVVVTNSRVYRHELQGRERFTVIGAVADVKDPSALIPLGYLDAWGRVVWYRLKTKYVRSFETEQEPITDSCEVLFNTNSDVFDLPIRFRDLLTRPYRGETERMVRDDRILYVGLTRGSNVKPHQLEISDIWWAKRDDVNERIEDFRRRRLKSIDNFQEIFAARADLRAEFAQEMKKFLGYDGGIRTDDLIFVTEKLLDAAQKHSKAFLERAILLSGLWSVAGENRDRSTSDKEASGLGLVATAVSEKAVGWKGERAYCEFLVTVQFLEPEPLGKSLHEAFLSGVAQRPAEDRMAPVLDYVVAGAFCGFADEPAAPQHKWLRNEYSRIKNRIGPNIDLVEHLVERERDSRNSDALYQNGLESIRAVLKRMKSVAKGVGSF